METQTLPFNERGVSGFADISASLPSTSSHIGEVKGNQSFIPGLRDLVFEFGAMVFWQLLASAPLTVTSFPSTLPLLVTVTHSVW